MNFDNSYARLPKDFHAAVKTDAVAAPSMLAWNQELASELGLDSLGHDQRELAEIFSGAVQPPGAQPIAMAYAGHQFGHFSPQLGDGRAALLGEVVTDAGTRYDIQLKGSGRTPFSRGGPATGRSTSWPWELMPATAELSRNQAFSGPFVRQRRKN